ncbi:hypothetical protein HYV81_05115 [Candidatus Woesearchaeota archaeon]|nr:hypothetical protein [Candidatus Woesearchaeota archaeon]
MPKQAKKEVKQSLAKELFAAEEQVLFEFFEWSFKKRHFYSIASVLFSLSLGLFIVKRKTLSWSLVLAVFVISLLIIVAILRRRGIQQKMTLLERLLALYTIALLFAVLYFIINFLLGDGLLSIKEMVFLLSIATLFETITFHVH